MREILRICQTPDQQIDIPLKIDIPLLDTCHERRHNFDILGNVSASSVQLRHRQIGHGSLTN